MQKNLRWFSNFYDPNPNFMREIFHHSPNLTEKIIFKLIPETVKFGNKSLRSLEAPVWNSLPEYIR